MKVSSTNLVLTEEDILSIIEDYIDVEGLVINSIQIRELITVKGSYKRKVTIPFTAQIGLGNIHGNIVNLKLFSVKVSKIGIFKGIKNIALKKILSQFQEYGVKVDKDTITLELDTVSKLVPYFYFKLKGIRLAQGVIEIEAQDVIYCERKPIVNMKKNCEPSPRRPLQDEYSKVRGEILRKIPHKYDRVVQYAMLIPDITALFWRLFKDSRVSVKVKIKAAAVIAYLASPIDILPDFIPLVGGIDDVAIAFFGLNAIINEVPKELILQNWQGEENIILLTQSAVRHISKIVGSQNVNTLLSFIKEIFEREDKRVNI